MKVSDFLKHHGINLNPFSEEDAQSDSVFQKGCSQVAHHPAWDKIYGDPALPATSIVFGEKGAGKTALKIQMTGELNQFNEANPDKKDFVIQYDNFNPFLDAFQEHFSRGWKKPEKFLKYWKLWDHIDAILSLGITKLVDQALQVRDANGTVGPELNLKKLDDNQKRDFLLLAALYDQSTAEGQHNRWTRLRKKLGGRHLAAWKSFAITAAWFLAFAGLAAGLYHLNVLKVEHFKNIYLWILLFLGLIPWGWRHVSMWWKARTLWKNLKVRNFDQSSLRKILLDIPASQLDGQPLPVKATSDDRYSLLAKFSTLTKLLGYQSIVILIDRVDEPYLINGSAPLMRDLIWPILDNKLLKFPNVAFKMLLPEELYGFAKKESDEFKERSRLDKQNLIDSLSWTGQSLYDLVNARLAACTDTTMTETPETLDNWFESAMTMDHLTSSLERVKTPRRVFKFLHTLLVEHANSFTDQNPQWKISTNEFDSTLKVFLKE